MKSEEILEMDLAGPPAGRDEPAAMLEAVFDKQIENAIHAVRSDLQNYESLRNISEVVGGEYGDRVVYELFQNAHDAHPEGDHGEVMLRLTLDEQGMGDLFVANAGEGFEWANVKAIRNVAVSSKTVGEGIGNKGLGFRSVETLTDDARIYSQREAKLAPRFDGFCFRFASRAEVRERIAGRAENHVLDGVAATLTRYLAAVPLTEQPEKIRRFAREGCATVVHLPLKSREAGAVARQQMLALLDSDAPLLLFLDRLRRVVIEVQVAGERPIRQVLTRTVLERPLAGTGSVNSYELAVLNPGGQRFLVARKPVARKALADAVERSIAREPQLARWRDWRGEPTVAVATPLDHAGPAAGRVYNFLPMTAALRSPLRGHVDAPFYASIDRRRAAFDLPLNALLMDELAATAAAASVDLHAVGAPFGRHLVFDLIAWDAKEPIRLMKGQTAPARPWHALRLVPAAGGDDAWSTVGGTAIWEEKGYRLLRARRLTQAGVIGIADPALGAERLQRLQQLMAVLGRSAAPSAAVLATWCELLAASLHREGAGPRTWSTFYEEMRRALVEAGALREARGKRLLRIRGGELAAASAGGTDQEAPVYLRLDDAGRRRESGRAPPPPPALARKYSLFDDEVALKPETAAEFVKAGLCRRYDAVELLSGIAATFTDKPAPARREAALRWAFDVWKAEPQRAEPAIRRLGLHVQVQEGWIPARLASFSEGWTRNGHLLETYLAEAAPVSPSCAQARGSLLVREPGWTPTTDAARREWVRFLIVAGVNDGLTPIATEGVPTIGTPSWIWNGFLRNEARAAGRDASWVALARRAVLHNPQTDYRRRGELWLFPGQIESGTFPPETRARLAELMLAHLAQKGDEMLEFRLGRYERSERDWNEVRIPTPAGAFIRAGNWLPHADDPDRFSHPGALWSTSDGRQRPRFVASVQERLAARIEDDDALRILLMLPVFGLKDWASPAAVVSKLHDLATAAPAVEQRDRVPFRRAYKRAWAQAAEIRAKLPSDLPLAVSAGDGVEVVRGHASNRPAVYVTADGQRHEARALAHVGLPVLELADEPAVTPVIDMLRASGGYDPRPIRQEDVVLVVDGSPFAPSLSDPLLASAGREWLVDAALLANEVLGRELERQISAAAVEQRLRRVRYRFCGTIELQVGGAAAGEPIGVHAYDDDANPTLLVAGAGDVSWTVLADAAAALSSLLDRRMRSLELLLLRLAASQIASPEQRPDDDALAQALRCPLQLVQEHGLARRGSGDRLQRLLVPVVACLAGLEPALELQARISADGDRVSLDDVVDEARLGGSGDRDALTGALREVDDLAELRRRLGIGFGDLNRALVALGRAPLSNEAELRRLFDMWKEDLAPGARERLRRRHLPAFRDGADLAPYLAQRSLSFVTFDEGWVMDREDLDRETVRRRMDQAIDALPGDEPIIQLEDLATVQARNKRTFQKAIDEAAPVVRAWLHRREREAGVWGEGTLAALKVVDRAGLLDFEAIAPADAIAHMARAGLWPADMERTLDLGELGIDPQDMLGDKRRQEQERKEKARELRTITFAGQPLDTGASDFAERLAELADRQMEDGGWLKRSRRRFALNTIAPGEDRRPGPGAGGPGGKRRTRPSDALRQAMGFASEYLVSRWLRERFGERFTEASWVSGNREHATTLGDGEDGHGYDFRIKLIEHDWLYEVKSSLDDRYEFEFTQNEMRVAASASKDTRHKYRILFVPFVFDPGQWRVMELPNPMTESGRKLFRTLGANSTRFRFDPTG